MFAVGTKKGYKQVFFWNTYLLAKKKKETYLVFLAGIFFLFQPVFFFDCAYCANILSFYRAIFLPCYLFIVRTILRDFSFSEKKRDTFLVSLALIFFLFQPVSFFDCPYRANILSFLLLVQSKHSLLACASLFCV